MRRQLSRMKPKPQHKGNRMTNKNQSTTQPTEQEKELQAISNAAYDKAIDNGCSEEEAEAISNKAYDNAEETQKKPMTHSIPTKLFHDLIMKQENEREEIRRNTPPFYHFILYTGSKRCPTTLEYQSKRFNTLREAEDGYTAWLEKSNAFLTNDWFPIFYFVENGEGTQCV